jgi:hypothetical protein
VTGIPTATFYYLNQAEMEKPFSTVSKYTEQERRKFVAEWRTGDTCRRPRSVDARVSKSGGFPTGSAVKQNGGTATSRKRQKQPVPNLGANGEQLLRVRAFGEIMYLRKSKAA